MMVRNVRITYPTALVLTAISRGFSYGFDIMDATGLPSGTVYPVLRRLEGAGLLESGWEEVKISEETGRPRRKFYELTEAGRGQLVAAEEKLVQQQRILGSLPPQTVGEER